MIALLTRWRTGALCLAMAGAFLVLGWWPFAPSPCNGVAWLGGSPGLKFQPPGIAYDEQMLPASPAGASAGFTIELRLEASAELRPGVNHILTLDDGDSPARLAICQWKSEVILRLPDEGYSRGFREAGIEGLEPRPRVIAITCSAAGTTFFADGRPVARYPRFVVSPDALRGRLTLGDAAIGKHAWTGKIFGIVLFNRPLDAAEIATHHRAWTSHDHAALGREAGLMALYLFDEGTGDHTADQSAARHRIDIPVRYRVPHKSVLELPRDLGVLLHADLRDSIENLLGFVPFGFLVFHYRRLCSPGRGLAAAMFAVLAGGGLSLIIELGQVWLPTRVSSGTDLIFNTVGTVLGVLIAICVKP